MKSLRTVSILALLSFAASVQASPTTYSGSLSSADGGIQGTGGWVADPSHPVTFSWAIVQNTDQSWHYQYQFNTTGLQGTLSHLLLETSLNLTHQDITNANPSIQPSDPTWYTSANGNPYIPAPLFGIKFDGTSGSVVTMQFDSVRNPTWGDFYAKDGSVGGKVWNAGFTTNDTDPLAAPQNGSIDNHILVPDTATTIPAPGALVLSSIGTGLLGWLRRRRTL